LGRVLALSMAFAAGLMMSIQPAVNASLGRKVGVLEGALISFIVGTLALIFIVFVFGRGNVMDIKEVPWYLLTGGLMGVFVVTTMILIIPVVGSGIGAITILTGQMMMAMIIDHYGLLGVPKIPFDMNRLLGIVLLFVSMRLIIGRL